MNDSKHDNTFERAFFGHKEIKLSNGHSYYAKIIHVVWDANGVPIILTDHDGTQWNWSNILYMSDDTR